MKNCLDLFHYSRGLNVEYVADLVFFCCLGRAFNSNSAMFFGVYTIERGGLYIIK